MTTALSLWHSGSEDTDLNVPVRFCQRFKANCQIGMRSCECLNRDRDLFTINHAALHPKLQILKPLLFHADCQGAVK